MTLTLTAVLLFAALQHVRSYLRLVIPWAVTLALVYLYYNFIDSHINNIALGVFFCVAGGLITGAMGYSIISESDADDGNVLGLALRRAAHLLEHGSELKEKTKMQILKVALVMCMPSLFCLGVLVFLVLGALGSYQLYDAILWKLFVTACALGIKIAGNKGLLILLGDLPM